MTLSFLIPLLDVTIRAGTSLLFAVLGETISERAGVLNLGIEGIMIVGAFAGFATAYESGSLVLGLIAAMIAGALLSLIHAFLSVTVGANQVISGVALVAFGTGLANLLGRPYIGKLGPKFSRVAIPLLNKIPVIGKVLFDQDPMIYMSFILVIIIYLFLYKTKYGLQLRATGEDPQSADAMGVNVGKVRYLAVIIGGMLIGLGGAHLSLSYVAGWQDSLTAGRGWVAVALVIFSSWNPKRAFLACLIFGGIEGIQFRLQATGIALPTYFLRMLPYISTILVMWFVHLSSGTKKKLGAPGALNKFFDRESQA